jgi:Ca2+-binding EF-hand superfamily protein
MDEAKDIKQGVARIWRMYKRQESLLRSAMGICTSCKLRRVFSNGYMMSLLFKKDLGSMYESVKSNLDDGELSAITRADDDASDHSSEYELLTQINLQQEAMLEEYRKLLSRLDKDSEAARACEEHIEKLATLEGVLAKELDAGSAGQMGNYSSVA